MPFQYLLTNLLVEVPGSRGVIFVDPEGEAVELVARRTTPYELKLEGAYGGIFLRQARALASQMGGGDVERMVISGASITVVCATLRSGYYLVLLMEPGASPAVAARAMARAAAALNREIP